MWTASTVARDELLKGVRIGQLIEARLRPEIGTMAGEGGAYRTRTDDPYAASVVL